MTRMIECRALVVRQPWAELIARGLKGIELRSWPTRYRGPLVICGGVRAAADIPLPASWGLTRAAVLALPRGVTVCAVDLEDCRPAAPGDSLAACSPVADGWYAWLLAGPRRLPPLPVTGWFRIFRLELPASALVA